MPIVIGIDPHKKTHTAVAIDDPSGRTAGEVTVKARTEGYDQLVRWARAIDTEIVFAVEDCRHVSGGLERHLIARGERIVRVSPKLMAGTRRQARTRGKSDPIDALAVARAALRETDLPEARLAGPELEVRMLVDHRETLVSRRSEDQSHLRWMLHDLDPNIEVAVGALDRYRVLGELTERVATMPRTVTTELCLELLARIEDVTRKANELERRITDLARAIVPSLLELPGVGGLTAAKIIGEVAGIDRFRTDAQLAMHAGVAPLPVSSGDRNRVRLNRSGNRQLNAAVHRIAVTQIRMHDPAKEFMARKLGEGFGKRRALRSLKRHIVRRLFNVMMEAKITAVAENVPAAA